ncbi:saccharopine dehydrogenase-like oxidoreductase [Aricia agestis]|uniref:saccharopine dehydrogenase-like oxidoreductase n=1 Tax=Aricia agestis TaxID=91739 RepID=UPI001C201D8C|nr:saccharopine dehydrogenase-like oxidoreductase [Aricia agestis]
MGRLDVVIFGASGYTGRHVVRAAPRLLRGLAWAVAGRDADKLRSALRDATNKIGEDITSIECIVADVSDADSLRAMCERARIVVNCCGPYRFYGEPVLQAAIQSRTHYVDVSGEPQFMELMQLRHGAEARASGVYAVSACGFDSIPLDLGVVHMQNNFTGTLNSVESYLAVKSTATIKNTSAINFGTWESLIYGLTHYDELKSLRKQLYPTPLPALKPKVKTRVLHRDADGVWCLPFPGADASVAYRTQRARSRPAYVRTYYRVGSLPAALATILAAIFLFLMTRTGFTRKLLLNYPALFTFGFVSKESPNEAVGESTEFELTLKGRGWPAEPSDQPPSKTITAKVSGVNPGYGLTAVMLLLSALTILNEPEKLPEPGVLTPGAAFGNTQLVRKLNDNGVKFEILP